MASTNMKKTVTTKSRKKKITKNIGIGAVYIKASFNNTLVTFTDLNGNAIALSSAGSLNYNGGKKSTPFAAQQAVETAAKGAKENGIHSVHCYIKGPGGGRESAIRALAVAELAVLSITDVSSIPHNGCRPPKRRRI